jgi:glyoxylase-like metal-dependent hydrolase (beta-lactamase superfamily II)
MADDIPFRKEMTFEYGVPRELAPGVQRLVANNPTPFTYKGTNAYILGQGRELMLIDPGPTDDVHFEAIMKLVGSRRLTHVVVTHTHRDHIDGLDRLVKATGAKTAGFGRKAPVVGAKKKSSIGEYSDEDFVPDVKLVDGTRLEGDGFALTAVHTPGHAPDHLCFVLEEEQALFSGDNVLGVGTTVIPLQSGDLGEYMASLDRMLALAPRRIYPAHGPAIEDGSGKIRDYIAHRKSREAQILAELRPEPRSVPDVVRAVYASYPVSLHAAAAQSTSQHLAKLEREGRAIRSGGSDALTALWRSA